MHAHRLVTMGIVVLVLLVPFAVDQTVARKRESGEGRRANQPIVATPGGTLPGRPEIALVLVAGGLAEPVTLSAPDDGSGRLFVVERLGRIRIIDRTGRLFEEPFLDLSSRVQAGYMEQGLLGLAFHPDYGTNGRFFVAYTDFRTNGDTFIVEFRVSPEDADLANPETERILLAVDQPFVEHNGGTLRFGPDGYLYIGMGDGGHGGDPYDNAQDRSSLLGKLLRIDVDNTDARAYGIPQDNPFAGGGRTDSPFKPASPQIEDRRVRRKLRPEIAPAILSESLSSQEARPEIWAMGLRNPWQFSFDPATGDLYLPDAGQRQWEELNSVPAGEASGANFGWDWLEASHCYPEDVSRCPRQQIGMLPDAEYEHGDDGCAVVGIGVYRGSASPTLDGVYFNSDFCSGKVWGLQRNSDDEWQYEELLDTDLHALGSGQDAAGELYLTATGVQSSATEDPFKNPTGTVWRVVATDTMHESVTAAPINVTPGATPIA